MCKHCKPKEATPAAEAGNLTDQLALLVRDLMKPLTVHYGEALRNQTADYIEGLEGLINRGEKLLLDYHESLIRNPEPVYRYFRDSEFTWRVHPSGRVDARENLGPGEWFQDTMSLVDLLLDFSIREIPNPDLLTD